MSGPVSHEFAGDPTSPAAARGFVRKAVTDLLADTTDSELSDDLELVVSELVTNAVRAGSPTVAVAVALERDRIVVRVSDRAEGWPEQRLASVHDTGGRGLPLVSALSTAWGVRLEGTGKVVWAELDVPTPH